MKISEQTLNILKNFSTINNSILVRPGNIVSTVTPLKTIFGKATVEEDFPKQFCIYELTKFLGVISLMNDPEFEFGDKQVTITSGKQSISYSYADESMIEAAPLKSIVMPSNVAQFELDGQDLSRMIKALSVLQLPEMSIRGDGEKIYLEAVNSKDKSSNKFSIEVGETGSVFNAFIKSEKIKMLNRTYHTTVSDKKVVMLESDNLTYWISCDQHSQF